MKNKLLVALSLIAGQAMAMELTIDSERATLTDTTEKMIVIRIQGQEREIPARFIPLIGTLAVLSKEDTPLQMSPMTLVSLDTWKLIEDQLERVYAMNQGSQQVRDEIIADYSQLDTTSLSDLIKVVDFLDIALLKDITLEVAQNRLTLDEVLELPELLCNEVIKRKALSIAGPVLIKEKAVCRGHEGEVWSVCFTNDDKIVSGSEDKTVRIWDRDGNQLVVCEGHEDRVSSVCVTSDNKIVSGSHDKTVRIWDMNGKPLAIYRGHKDVVTSVCSTPEGKIISGAHDTTVHIWGMDDQQLEVCRGLEEYDYLIGVTPDGKIISGSKDGTVHIGDMKGEELAVCRGHEDEVGSVCFTSDAKIVSGSCDKTVRIWNMNGTKSAVCSGHEGWVNSVVTHDGKIASGSEDGTVRVWDMNGKELADCNGHEDEVHSVCVAPNGKIISGSYDKTVRIWDISLLDRLSVMSKEQALAIGKLLPLATCENQEQKEHCWKEIEKILAEEELVVETKKRKELENSQNNPGKRLRLPEEEELIAEK